MRNLRRFLVFLFIRLIVKPYSRLGSPRLPPCHSSRQLRHLAEIYILFHFKLFSVPESRPTFPNSTIFLYPIFVSICSLFTISVSTSVYHISINVKLWYIVMYAIIFLTVLIIPLSRRTVLLSRINIYIFFAISRPFALPPPTLFCISHNILV